MNNTIDYTESLGNTSIAREANNKYDEIADKLIQYLKDQNITDITAQKDILARACVKLPEPLVELLELKLPESIGVLSKQNKKLLQENTVNIINAFKIDETYFMSLLESCVEYKIFNQNDKEKIQSGSTKDKQYQEFLMILPKRGKKAEAVIMQLQERGIIR
jgi:hypothetical protein